MAYLLIIISLMIFIVGRIIERKWANYLSTFALIWLVVAFLANLHLYNMVEISGNGYMLIIVGLLCYFIGYLIFYKKHLIILTDSIDKKCKASYELNWTFFNMVFILTIIAWTFLGILTIKELLRGIPYSVIRDIYAGVNEDYTLLNNKYVNVLTKQIFVPAVYVCIVKIVYNFFCKKISKIYYIGALYLLTCYCLTTGSRMILLNLIIQIIFLMSNNNMKVKISKKNKKRIFIIGVVIIVAIIVLSNNRARTSNGSWTTQMTYYAYGSLPIPLSEYWMKYIDSENILTYGVAFFRGIIGVLYRIKIPLPSVYFDLADQIGYVENTFVKMFTGRVYNAFITVFLYFYMDFRYPGLIIGSFIFGSIAALISYNNKTKRDEISTLIYLIFLISVIKSFSRWEFSKTDYVMQFILMRFLFHKSKKIETSEK